MYCILCIHNTQTKIQNFSVFKFVKLKLYQLSQFLWYKSQDLENLQKKYDN
jgi:hypothetical protein